METFKNIEEENRLLYKYVRGSNCHGIATPNSDVDEGGVFMGNFKNLFGFNYEGQVSNETNDFTWYEFKKFMLLLSKSNPTILESLFVDDEFVIFEHPIFTELKKNRDEFLTKKCFESFLSYADSQIQKAKSLNKMINWKQPERKELLDFCYTFNKQGSTKLIFWLEYRNLNQKYVGLVKIPNMYGIYGVYYDWLSFFNEERIDKKMLEKIYHTGSGYKDTSKLVKSFKESESEKDKAMFKKCIEWSHKWNMIDFIINFYNLRCENDDETLEKLFQWYDSLKVEKYHGIVTPKSTSLRLSPVSKGEKPICYLSYNENSYIKHCVNFKNYNEWVKKRNPLRYKSNLLKNYDGKNMCECFRLMKCGLEIAKGEGFKVNRSKIDSDFLLDIKAHKFEYDELMEKVTSLNEEMHQEMEKSSLKEDVDKEFIEKFYTDSLKEFWKGRFS